MKLSKQLVNASIIFITSIIPGSTFRSLDDSTVQVLLSFLGLLDLWSPAFRSLELYFLGFVIRYWVLWYLWFRLWVGFMFVVYEYLGLIDLVWARLLYLVSFMCLFTIRVYYLFYAVWLISYPYFFCHIVTWYCFCDILCLWVFSFLFG